MAWFKEHPNLLAEELDALHQLGYEFTINQNAKNEGFLIIDVIYPIDGEKHQLTCSFPAAYPYFAVKVIAPTFPPGRHIDPFSKCLCLFEGEQSSWDPASDTLASVLHSQIPFILNAHANPSVLAENEGRVGYQVSGQFLYENYSAIFVNDFQLPENAVHGKLKLKVSGGVSNISPIKGFAEKIEVEGGVAEFCGIPANFSDIFTKKLTARWVKLDAPPVSSEGEKILDEAILKCPSIKNPIYQSSGVDIVGLYFPEESEYLEVVHNWVFVVRRRQPKNKNKNKNVPAVSIIRSDRVSSPDLSVRTPRLSGLNNKSVLLIGAGALGSHIAWQLVRAGIQKINIIDHDVLQAGNTPRWLLGFSAVGRLKVEVLTSYFSHNYPHVSCAGHNMCIGVQQRHPVDGGFLDADEFLRKLIVEADIVIDAAAETNVSLYSSSLCEQLNKPYVWATGTQGAWGGIVGRFIPGVTKGTWKDFSYMYHDKKFTEPPAEEDSNVQPVGCFHETFTGSGFDLDHASLMASRLASATLMRNVDGGYPNFNWDVGILHLWDENKKIPIAPSWETFKLMPYRSDSGKAIA